MCPKCGSLAISDVTDSDDKQRMLFCGGCTFQAPELEFQVIDGPAAESERPSLFRRLVDRIRG